MRRSIRTGRSTGEVISSFAFALVGLWLMSGAASTSDVLIRLLLGICALACFAGAFRFQIARLMDKVRSHLHDGENGNP